MMVSKIGEQAIESLLIDNFRSLYEQHYGRDFFIDKTPGLPMLKSLPTILKAWPNIRIIFCKRRGLENIESRRRKWRNTLFVNHCRDWHSTMQEWASLKPTIPSSQWLEIDQHDIVENTATAAQYLTKFLGLGEEFQNNLQAYFTNHHPEKTTSGSYDVLTLDTVAWSDEDKASFTSICGKTMVFYNYGLGESYYLDAAANKPNTIAIHPHPAKGFLDGVANNSCWGWAYHPDRTIEVQIKIDDTPAAHAMANQFRPDLLKARLGDGNCAFNITIPNEYMDGKTHTIAAYDKVTGFNLTNRVSQFTLDKPKPKSSWIIPETIELLGSRQDTEDSAKKYAFLILAHNQPNHLRKLLSALQDKDFYCFLHIDAKQPLHPFRELASDFKNVFLLLDRVNVAWGGFSLVKAQLYLLMAARNFPVQFHRYSYLSAADYPVQPISAIKEVLARENNFVQCGTVDPSHAHYERFTKYYLIDELPLLFPYKNQAGELEKKMAPFLNKAMESFDRDFNASYPKPELFSKLYRGANWISITQDFTDYLLDISRHRADIIEYFKYTRHPDESFFHTIFMHSPLRHTHRRLMQHNLHYVDFNANPGPKVLNEEDLDIIRSTPALFARKIVEGVSDRLVALIDTMLLPEVAATYTSEE